MIADQNTNAKSKKLACGKNINKQKTLVRFVDVWFARSNFQVAYVYIYIDICTSRLWFVHREFTMPLDFSPTVHRRKKFTHKRNKQRLTREHTLLVPPLAAIPCSPSPSLLASSPAPTIPSCPIAPSVRLSLPRPRSLSIVWNSFSAL